MFWKWIVAVLLFPAIALPQSGKALQLHFKPVCGNADLLPQQAFYLEGQRDSVRISVFKFYVSDVAFFKSNKLLYQPADSFFLMDFTDAASLQRQLPLPEDCPFDEIRFTLGIDEKTNDAGIGAGDLDPAKGMYWAWQTGYINMKMEGECIKSHQHFEFHLGGFLKPYLACRTVSLKTLPTADVAVYVDVAAFLNSISLDEIHAVMSPGEKAMALSDKAALMFRLK